MNFLESIAETQELVSLPTVATKVLSMLEKDEVDIREISKHIESDASITMKILRLANSPMFALRSPVSSINQAILTIGLNRVTNIVLGVSIFSKFVYLSRSSAAQFVDKFWQHSAATASVAKALSTKLRKNFQDAEFLGGLIHDIGKLAMLQHDAELFVKVDKQIIDEQANDGDVERTSFGASHSEAGNVIGRMWKLPDALNSVIAYHDNISEAPAEHKGVVSVVRFADILCEQWGAGIGENVQSVEIQNDISWKNLCSLYPELSSVNVTELCSELEQDYKKASQTLTSMLSD